MPRVRWADLGPEEAATAAGAQPQQPDPQQAVEDAWGPEIPQEDTSSSQQPPRPVSQAQQQVLAALLQHAQRQPVWQEPPQQRPQRLLKLLQKPPAPPQQQQPQQQPPISRHDVPSLHRLCMTVLGQHVTAVVEQLGDQVQWLPSEVRAALLAVARRRGEVTGPMLCSLADDSWRQLDVAGCSRLYATELLAAARRMPRLAALDVTGCERISAGGWRQLAEAWPHLQVIRLGGSAACSEAALKALPHILPGVPPAPHKASGGPSVTGGVCGVGGSAAAGVSIGDSAVSDAAAAGAGCAPQATAAAAAAVAVADSWEDAFASSDSEGEEEAAPQQVQLEGGSSNSTQGQQQQQQAGSSTIPGSNSIGSTVFSSSSSSSSGKGRLKHLQALLWPDVPSAAVQLVQQRCPRVLINPELKPDKLTGEMPPREWYPAPLDEPCMQMVLPAALQPASSEAVTAMAAAAAQAAQQQQEPVIHIAEKFRMAYIDRARRLKEKERRMAAAQERKQLKASHALRTLNAWLDERE